MDSQDKLHKLVEEVGGLLIAVGVVVDKLEEAELQESAIPADDWFIHTLAAGLKKKAQEVKAALEPLSGVHA